MGGYDPVGVQEGEELRATGAASVGTAIPEFAQYLTVSYSPQ